MKNNKKSPLTIARQAAFIEEMGGEYPTQMSPEFNELKKEFIGIDTDDQKQSRIAMESTAQGYRENCPELYGRTLRQTRQKYAGEVLDYKPSAGMKDCGPELSEVESVLVTSAGHNQKD